MLHIKTLQFILKPRIILLILLFVFGNQLNTECFAFQVKKDTLDYWNVQKFVINQKTSQEQLDEMQSRLKTENVTIDFSDISRDELNGYLKGLKITYKSLKSNGTYIIDSSKPYKPIAIQYDVVGKTISIGPNPTSNLSQTIALEPQRVPIPKANDTLGNPIKIVTENSTNKETSRVTVRDTVIKKNEYSLEKADTLSIHTETKDNNVYLDKESRAYVLKRVDGIVMKDSLTNGPEGNVKWFSKDDIDNNLIYTENGQKILIKGSSEKPMIIIDGTVYEQELNLIDSNDIKSINVLKGEKAIEKYGETANNGVIEIKTKNATIESVDDEMSLEVKSVKSTDEKTSSNYMTLYIQKDADFSDLEKQRDYLKKIGVEVEYTKIQRDDVKDITRIKISLKDDQGNTASSIFSDIYGIPLIYFGKDKKGLFISKMR